MVMTRNEVIELITDMTEGKASLDEMARVIDFSKEVINAEKHINGYYASYDIGSLIERYGKTQKKQRT